MVRCCLLTPSLGSNPPPLPSQNTELLDSWLPARWTDRMLYVWAETKHLKGVLDVLVTLEYLLATNTSLGPDRKSVV